MGKKGKVAVLISGRGSNFEAIHRYALLPEANYRIVAVISDKKEALGLKKARELDYPAYFIDPSDFSSKLEFEKQMTAILKEKGTQLVCLAGYMRIVGRTILNEYPHRIINIHPALLPSFPGLDAQKKAIEYGVKVSGCTVHFVDNHIDSGPIIIQQPVPVIEGDDEETLSNRILIEEHRIYPRAIQLFFAGALKIVERRVIVSNETI